MNEDGATGSLRWAFGLGEWPFSITLKFSASHVSNL